MARPGSGGPAALAALKRAEAVVTAAERGALVVLLVFMVGLSFLQVALRFANTGILWGDTLLRHLVIIVGFLGAALAAAQDRQFAVDATERLFSGRTKSAAHLVARLFTSAVCAGLAWASVKLFRVDLQSPAALFSVGRFEVPNWTFELVLPAGFALLLFHYLVKSAEAAARLAGAAPPEGRHPPTHAGALPGFDDGPPAA